MCGFLCYFLFCRTCASVSSIRHVKVLQKIQGELADSRSTGYFKSPKGNKSRLRNTQFSSCGGIEKCLWNKKRSLTINQQTFLHWQIFSKSKSPNDVTLNSCETDLSNWGAGYCINVRLRLHPPLRKKSAFCFPLKNHSALLPDSHMFGF